MGISLSFLHCYRCDRSKGAFVWHKKLVNISLPISICRGPIAVNGPSPVKELKKHLEQFTIPKRVLDEDEDGFLAGIVRLSYHHWVSIGLTLSAVLVNYLALWLKRYAIASMPRECHDFEGSLPYHFFG